MSEPLHPPPKRRATFGHWVSFALLVGLSVVFGFVLGSEAGERPVAQLTLKLSRTWQQSVAVAPRVLAPIREYDWPGWLLAVEPESGEEPESDGGEE